jgi:CelD/BcsL family acetyltransferase involved in cellulose biosynthesis
MNTVTGPIPLGEGWEAQIYHEWVFPLSLIEAWEEMARAYGDTGVFLSPAWFEPWWNAFGRPDRLFVAVLEQGGEPRAIFPCWTPDDADPLSASGRIESLTNDHAHYFDFLVAPPRRQTALQKFAGLVRQIKPRAKMKVEYLCEPDGTESGLYAELSRGRIPVHRYEAAYSPYLPLAPTTWEEYLKTIQSKFKANLKRRRQKAEQIGTVSFEATQDLHRFEDRLSEAFDVEYRSWKGKEGTAIKCLPDVERFYRELVQRKPPSGRFHLFSLRLKGRMIAFNLCVSSHKTLFLLKTGYNDEEFSALSPGQLLHYEMLRHLFEGAEFRRYTFGGVVSPWKTDWTDPERSYRFQWLEGYPATLLGRLEYGCRYGWKTYLKRFRTARRIKEWAAK